LRQQPLNKNWHQTLGETSKICGQLINHILFQTVANIQLEEHQNIFRNTHDLTFSRQWILTLPLHKVMPCSLVDFR